MTATLHTDDVFAPVDRDLYLERIAGGNETEVYRTDDQRYVVKLKHELGGSRTEALDCAKTMRAAAEQFAACIGEEHSIPSYYLLARDSSERVQVLVIQPFVAHAHPLYDVDYRTLNADERDRVAAQLRAIIRRALSFYRGTRSMPDVYGRTSTSAAERKRLRSPWKIPERLWSFMVQRNLLRSHNLLLTNAPECRVVLVDYDFVRRSRLYRWVYYTVRRALFWRDQVLIWRMRRGAKVPRADSLPAIRARHIRA
ncbi:MAG TPA: hypothetical protein VFZ66_01075 [Herpetosiphonaceae bacterium]